MLMETCNVFDLKADNIVYTSYLCYDDNISIPTLNLLLCVTGSRLVIFIAQAILEISKVSLHQRFLGAIF
jgi:hypothetical protein